MFERAAVRVKKGVIEVGSVVLFAEHGGYYRAGAGAEVEAGGLRLTAEGARDRRGRMRVHAVVVEPVDPEPADAGAGHEQEEN